MKNWNEKSYFILNSFKNTSTNFGFKKCASSAIICLCLFKLQRLLIAREFDDKAAERRAFSNLGNAHVFLGEFEIAVEYYK